MHAVMVQQSPFNSFYHQFNYLKEELLGYLACAVDASSEVFQFDWWKRNDGDLSKWADAIKMSLLQSSSEAAKGASVLLQNSFGEQQDHSLQD